MYYTENSFLFPTGPNYVPLSCGDNRKCSVDFSTGLYFFSPLILGQNFIGLANFVFQVIAIRMVYTSKTFQKGSFFFLLLTLALSVIFRSLTTIITWIFAAFNDQQSIIYSTAVNISLYTDFISNNFSIVLISFMSLNRCLMFVKRSWSDQIFDGNRVVTPVSISLGLSIGAAVTSIRTSGIERIYNWDLGFVDFGRSRGYRKLITRLFYLFPLSSAICYIVLFYHLYRRKKELKAKNKTNKNNKGEQNVFIQVLITVAFYGAMSITSELLEYLDKPGMDLQLTLISIFNLLNYLPELSLPFLLVVNVWRPRRKVSVFVAPTHSNSHSLTKQTERKQRGAGV